MSKPKSSILITASIVSHGHGKLVDKLLFDIKKYCNTNIIKIILTNNIDDSYHLKHNSGLNINYINNELPKGFGENHNKAFDLCETEWFVIINPDISLKDDIFSSLINRYNNSNVGIVAPLVLNKNGDIEDSVRKNLTLYSLLKRFLCTKKQIYEVSRVVKDETGFYWFAGMFLFVNSRDFVSIGGFDENFHMYCEDFDLCARMYINGKVLIRDMELLVIHDARKDSHRSFNFLMWHIVSLMKVWTSTPFWKIFFNRRL